jgi:hypothetical protein
MKNTLVKNQDSKVLVENETIQINVPTRNRFSVLNTLNTEPNEFIFKCKDYLTLVG